MIWVGAFGEFYRSLRIVSGMSIELGTITKGMVFGELDVSLKQSSDFFGVD